VWLWLHPPISEVKPQIIDNYHYCLTDLSVDSNDITALVSGEQKHYFHLWGLQKPLVAFATRNFFRPHSWQQCFFTLLSPHSNTTLSIKKISIKLQTLPVPRCVAGNSLVFTKYCWSTAAFCLHLSVRGDAAAVLSILNFCNVYLRWHAMPRGSRHNVCKTVWLSEALLVYGYMTWTLLAATIWQFGRIEKMSKISFFVVMHAQSCWTVVDSIKSVSAELSDFGLWRQLKVKSEIKSP
jgi:hypothetical protein